MLLPSTVKTNAVGRAFVQWGIIAVLPLLLWGCPVSTDQLSDKNKAVQMAVDSVRAALEKNLQNQVPSLNVLIQTPTEKIFASSVPAGSTPITETTYYRFASNTKNFTSTAILNMHEEGWLNYKAKITDLMPGTTVPYVPDTPDWDFPNKKSITIEQLLQHSAGVYDVDNDPVPGFDGMSFTEYVITKNPAHPFTTDEMIQQLIIHKLSYFAPGTQYHYSNTGYAILGEIIKRVYSTKSGSAKTYGDYLIDFVTGPKTPVPLDIHFPVRADDTVLPKPRVEGLVLLPGKTEKYADYNMSGQIAEGNGYGTMAAINTYIRSLMKGQNVLKPETVKIMQTSVSSANAGYALGCTFRLNHGYGHNGARIGYLSVMAYDPATDVSVVALLPLWDLTKGGTSFQTCFEAMYDATYAARAALGYPGKP